MTVPAEVALTDDEVMALAHRHGKLWRAVLPTVPPGDAVGSSRAVFRGDRSLLARGLVTVGPDGGAVLDPSLQRLASAGLEGEVLVSAFTSDRDLTFDPEGFTYLNYAVEDGVLAEIVSVIGLHRFGEVRWTDAAGTLREVVRAVAEGVPTPGLGDVSDTFSLAFPAGTEDRRRVFAVRPGVVESAVITPADLPRVDRSTVPLVSTSLEDLIATIDRVYGRGASR